MIREIAYKAMEDFQKTLSQPYYLSIDLDFWEGDNLDEYLEWVNTIICDNYRHKPMLLCWNHQQMLSAVNHSKSRVLVNFDAHSDLYHNKIGALNCATWISYVKWRKQGVYYWVRDQQTSEFYGFLDKSLFVKYGYSSDSKFLDYKKLDRNRLDWLDVQPVIWRDELPNVSLFQNATEIGICLSPSHLLHEDWFNPLRLLFRKYPSIYKRGIRNEHSARERYCSPK